MPRIGFVTMDEYAQRPGVDIHAHEWCAAPLHNGEHFPAVVVIAIADGEDSIVFGACKDCFAHMDNDLGAEADWHIP